MCGNWHLHLHTHLLTQTSIWQIYCPKLIQKIVNYVKVLIMSFNVFSAVFQCDFEIAALIKFSKLVISQRCTIFHETNEWLWEPLNKYDLWIKVCFPFVLYFLSIFVIIICVSIDSRLIIECLVKIRFSWLIKFHFKKIQIL